MVHADPEETMTTTSTCADPGAARKSRRTLIMIAAAVIAPVALSYFFYYVAPRAAFTNYGELLPTASLPELGGTTIDGQPFRLADLHGKWTILVPAGGACDAACGETLYATRQARTMQGKDMDRVVRAWIVTDDAVPAPERLAEHPGIVVARLPASEVAKLPKGGNAVVLMDPLGNQVLAWPRQPDPKALAKDLGRLLKASRIG
jgi:cytochrome oxidase Cu insertion factor (SCO1/SenC/PrrC family)